ncbi:hypothetical protein [Salinispora tropica]|uniref:hypothetical protein n=1 Tax=Salinispora tropica TaxID=168695 RepID=UPI0016509538|nr:hypothetical protein [Salinispora tropica]
MTSKIAVLDLAHPTRRDPIGSATCHWASEMLSLLGKLVCADPCFSAGAFHLERVVVSIVQLGADVVPIMEVTHQPSQNFLSKASQPRMRTSVTRIAFSYHRIQFSAALLPAISHPAPAISAARRQGYASHSFGMPAR